MKEEPSPTIQENTDRAAGRFRSTAATHNGAVRTHNEDRYVNRPDLGLWAVADGAGGHHRGERASAVVAEALESVPPGLEGPELLAEARRLLTAAHATLRIEAEQLGSNAMIATTVAVLLAAGGHYACLWAGDSRIYLLRHGTLVQVTRDHSLVQELVDAGTITAAEAEGHPRANVITRAIGVDSDELELEKKTDRLVPGDRFLLCSDGVCKTLADDELGGVLRRPGEQTAAERLIEAAIGQRASDNITAVIVEYFAGADDDTMMPSALRRGA